MTGETSAFQQRKSKRRKNERVERIYVEYHCSIHDDFLVQRPGATGGFGYPGGHRHQIRNPAKRNSRIGDGDPCG